MVNHSVVQCTPRAWDRTLKFVSCKWNMLKFIFLKRQCCLKCSLMYDIKILRCNSIKWVQYIVKEQEWSNVTKSGCMGHAWHIGHGAYCLLICPICPIFIAALSPWLGLTQINLLGLDALLWLFCNCFLATPCTSKTTHTGIHHFDYDKMQLWKKKKLKSWSGVGFKAQASFLS